MFNRLLQSGVDCFGALYSASAPECRVCTAPVVHEGRLCLLSEVCAMASAHRGNGNGSSTFRRLSSEDVIGQLEAGRTLVDIFRDMTAGTNVDAVGAAARAYLNDRLRYIKTERGMPVPPLPRLKELKDVVSDPPQD